MHLFSSKNYLFCIQHDEKDARGERKLHGLLGVNVILQSDITNKVKGHQTEKGKQMDKRTGTGRET